MELIRNLRNELDFFLRSLIRFERPVPAAASVPDRDVFFQKELEGFFSLFSWPEILAGYETGATLRVLDVGARNFASGPVLEKLFQKAGHPAEIHGIEIDAFRRYRDFRSRYDYGTFYAKKMQNGHFHAADFLSWNSKADIIFLLNPFVSSNPTLAWGLPLRTLRAEDLFRHTASLLAPGGIVVLSTPSSDEYQIALEHAGSAGLSPRQEALWEPDSLSLSKMPRHGRILVKS